MIEVLSNVTTFSPNREPPGLDITPISKSGKGIAALQNGATLIGTFKSDSFEYEMQEDGWVLR